MSSDAQQLLQLRVHLAQMSMREQQTRKLAEFQQAALMSTINDVAELEAHNSKLKQSLLVALQRLDATAHDGAVKAKCSVIAGQIGLFASGSSFEHDLERSPPALVLQLPPDGSKAESPLSKHALDVASVVHDAVQLGPSQLRSFESNPSSEQAEVMENAETIASRTSEQPQDGNFVWPESATTVLIRNVPPRSSMEDLIKAFPPDGSYDLVHLPFNIKSRRTSSFATINFISVELAAAFRKRFHGQRLPNSTRSKDALIVMPANVQGLEANLAFLLEEKGVAEMRNSALLPRLYLAGTAAARLVSTAPSCIQQPDEPGQPNRLDCRKVFGMLNNLDEI